MSATSQETKYTQKKSYALPLVLVLFFMWGLAISSLVLEVSKGQSGLVQFAVYGAYFLMALPTGYFIRLSGYKKGILLGLPLYCVGAFLFYPAAYTGTFDFFLTAFCAIGCGLAILETVANPYLAVLGESGRVAFRLTSGEKDGLIQPKTFYILTCKSSTE